MWNNIYLATSLLFYNYYVYLLNVVLRWRRKVGSMHIFILCSVNKWLVDAHLAVYWWPWPALQQPPSRFRFSVTSPSLGFRAFPDHIPRPPLPPDPVTRSTPSTTAPISLQNPVPSGTNHREPELNLTTFLIVKVLFFWQMIFLFKFLEV